MLAQRRSTMRNLTWFAVAGGAGFLGASLIASCGSTDVTCEDLATCPGGAGGADGGSGKGGGSGAGAAGSDAGGQSGDANGTCDPKKSPAESPCVIDNRYGVFVSPTGNDTTGTGKKDAPFKTIGKGLAAATDGAKRIYVCDDGAGYAEQITI